VYSCEIVYQISLFIIDIIYYHSWSFWLLVYQNCLADECCSPSSSEIYQLKGTTYRILKTTSNLFKYSTILFCYVRSVQEHLKVLSEYLRRTSVWIQHVRKLLGAFERISIAVQNSWVAKLWLPNHFTFCWCRQVGWLHQHQYQSFPRFCALYLRKLPETKSLLLAKTSTNSEFTIGQCFLCKSQLLPNMCLYAWCRVLPSCR